MQPANNEPIRRMPVLFIGHGSPMNAIENNQWSRAYHELGARLPKPKVILSISAHWFVTGTFLTGNEQPRTIHDFGGFPPELYKIEYPARGNLNLANRAVELIGSESASISNGWGLDHGTWAVLVHLFPNADIPVVQLSINRRLPLPDHIELGRKLQPLREEGVLIMGSGNITHNLHDAMSRLQTGDNSIPNWAQRFDDDVTTALSTFNANQLCKLVETEDGKMSHPSIDHYLPLLYVVGAASKEDFISFPISGFELGSLSMRSILFS